MAQNVEMEQNKVIYLKQNYKKILLFLKYHFFIVKRRKMVIVSKFCHTLVKPNFTITFLRFFDRLFHQKKFLTPRKKFAYYGVVQENFFTISEKTR